MLCALLLARDGKGVADNSAQTKLSFYWQQDIRAIVVIIINQKNIICNCPDTSL